MTARRQIQFFVFLAIFLLSIMLMNRFVRSALKKSVGGNMVETKETEKSGASEKMIDEQSKYHLIPDDPAQYNIKFQGRSDVPLTEQQWEYQMRQGLTPSRTLGQGQDQSLAGIQKTPQEIKERLEEIESQIKEYEAIALNNPGDQKARERLQTLFMLKATLTVLKDKITSHNPQPNEEPLQHE